MTKCRITITEVPVPTEPPTTVYQIRIESDNSSWQAVANNRNQLAYTLHGMRIALSMCADAVGSFALDEILTFTPESFIHHWLDVP